MLVNICCIFSYKIHAIIYLYIYLYLSNLPNLSYLTILSILVLDRKNLANSHVEMIMRNSQHVLTAIASRILSFVVIVFGSKAFRHLARILRNIVCTKK